MGIRKKWNRAETVNFYKRLQKNVQTYFRTKTGKDWAFIAISFFSGVLSFIVFMDLMIMPLYQRNGQETIVPDLSGKTWPEAYKIARENQLLITTDGTEYHESIEKNKIASQRPVAGSKVKPGRRVHVMLSKGQEFVKVPNMIGKSLLSAEIIIREAGLTVSEKITRSSRRFPSGTVMRQYPRAGMEVQSGTGISLYIAR